MHKQGNTLRQARISFTHSLVQAISEVVRILQAAQEMLLKFQISITKEAQEKMDHNKVIAKLTSILRQEQQQQDPDQVAMVGADARPPRVTMQTIMTDQTDPETMQTSKWVHL